MGEKMRIIYKGIVCDGDVKSVEGGAGWSPSVVTEVLLLDSVMMENICLFRVMWLYWRSLFKT